MHSRPAIAGARRPAPARRSAGTAAAVAAALMLALAAAPAVAAPVPESFADLTERLLPSVVNISATRADASALRPPWPQLPPGEPFDSFRWRFEREGPEQPGPEPLSLGSGFIIDGAGIIVTNNHVVENAEGITVTLQDNSRFEAEVLGRDPKTDIAVLGIDAGRDLPAVAFGDSLEARVGDWVLAIGNPFGLGGTVTAGIISARHRDIRAGPYDSFIQTDASINRGNSGGPLFDIDGNVIGVNTAIFSPSGGSVGIGFAVPSELARGVVRQLREFGRTRRGWLGVRIQAVDEDIAEALDLDDARGAFVAHVIADGPAQVAGIRDRDIILQFDGRDIAEMRDLPRIVAETEIGRNVEVSLWRDSAAVTVQVEIGELEEESDAVAAAAEAPPEDPADAGRIPELGIVVAGLTDALRRQYGLAETAEGMLVVEVTGDGPAAEKGIRAGDVIVEVTQQEVASAAAIRARVAEARGLGRDTVLLLVEREGHTHFLALRFAAG